MVSGTILASGMGMVGDCDTDGAAMVVSFAGVLDMTCACWKTGGWSVRNSFYVFTVCVRYLWYEYQRYV